MRNFFLIFLLAFSVQAFANVPWTTTYIWADNVSCPASTPQGVCDCSNALNGIHMTAQKDAQSGIWHCVDANHFNTINIVNSCPAGFTKTSTDCAPITCPPPQEIFNGSCVSPCPAGQARNGNGVCTASNCSQKAGQSYSASHQQSGGTGFGCGSSGCAVQIHDCFTTQFDQSGVPIAGTFNCAATYTGSACSPTVGPSSTKTVTTAPTTTTTTPAPAPGTPITPGTVETTTSVKNADGSVTTTTTTVVTAPDGSKTTTISGQTTKNGTGSGGSGGGTGTGVGDGSGSGPAGDCDPTRADYEQCLGMLVQQPSDLGQSMIDGATTTVGGYFDQFKSEREAAITEAASSSGGDVSGLSSSFTNIFPSASNCTPMVMNFPGHPLTLPCDHFEEFKALFGWFLYGLTIIYIFRLATKPIGE